MPVHNRIAGMTDEMAGWRQWLHRHPELSFDLPVTSAYVAERLTQIGVDALHRGIAQTGMVALIHGRGPGPVIGLRADMDALPISEETGAAYASESPGKMHACGHDGHTTMLLGAAAYLAETRNFAGTVALLFQPAEEEGNGGEVMVKEGVFDRFGIEEVYALHTSPLHEAGTFHMRTGPILAGSAEFDIAITGAGGHAAAPEMTADPVAAALQLGQALMTIVPRNVPAIETVVVSLTNIHAGTVHNVIPGTATMCGTVRAYAPEMLQHVAARMRAICDGIGTAMGVTVTLDWQVSLPATVNTPAETDLAARIAAEVVGAAQVDTKTAPLMGGEDFSYMLQARPGAFVFLGQGVGPYCHHPAFDFNDAVAPVGASYFATLVERRLPLDGAA